MKNTVINNKKKKDKKTGIVRLSAMALVATGTVLLMSGCGSIQEINVGGSSSVFRIGKEKCSPQEAKIILLNYQKEYGECYGIDMWAHDYGEEQSLEDYIKDLTLAQLAQVYTLDIIAGEQEVTLSEDEEALISKASEEYFSGLGEEEIAYLEIDQDDVTKLYERYVLAKKLYQTVTESVEPEVSDDEARVMRFYQIYTTDKAKADDLFTQLENGSDFSTLAASNNEAGSTEIVVNRTTFSEDVTTTLFDMQEGSFSEVLPYGDGYYLFYCVSAFDSELTEAHKEDVLEQRMTDAVNSTYASYTGELNSSVNNSVWEEISVDTSLNLEGESFFEVYDKYFEQ